MGGLSLVWVEDYKTKREKRQQQDNFEDENHNDLTGAQQLKTTGQF